MTKASIINIHSIHNFVEYDKKIGARTMPYNNVTNIISKPILLPFVIPFLTSVHK